MSITGSRRLSAQGVSGDAVRAYLDKIGRVALLSAAEEIELAKRIEVGLYAAYQLSHAGIAELASQFHRDLRFLEADGRRAKDSLVEANLRLVVSISKRYSGRGMALLDLVQEGNIGLIRAVEKFDYKKGYKFSTYATWWIRQTISRAMADQARTIRLPVHVAEIVNKLGRVREQLARDKGRDPTIGDLAAALDLNPHEIIELTRHSREPTSLDQAIGDNEAATLGDLISDPDELSTVEAVSHSLLRHQLRAVLTTLTEREAGVIRMRFGLVDGQPRTLEQIGDAYGVTRERVRQIETKTIAKLRQPTRSEPLRDYLL